MGKKGGLVGPWVIYRWRGDGPAGEVHLAHLVYSDDTVVRGLVGGVKVPEGGTRFLHHFTETDESCAFAPVGPAHVLLYGVLFRFRAIVCRVV